MGNPLKSFIQKQLYNRCYKKYEAEVSFQNNRYARFLEARSEKAKLDIKDGDFQTQATKIQILSGKQATVFYQDNGILESRALELFDACFAKNPTCVAAYADQDYVDSQGERHSPWFKPIWSPDTLADSFYVGSVFALRSNLADQSALKACKSIADARALFVQTIKMSIRKIGVSAAGCDSSQVMRIEEILFHEYYEQPWKGIPEYELRQNPKEDERLSMPLSFETNLLTFSRNKDNPFVSVIIPSKDNPEVLERCIRSLKDKTTDIEYEIIVVDNGSSPENQDKLKKLSSQFEIRYEYHPMDFNFSKMCNLGAAKAKGNYLLFLNDDMEIISSDWMYRMWEMACRKHVGAVGAKLYYPSTTIIQHAGVTNLEIGPAHKMQHDDDTIAYYHGRNRGVHDMLAVTAACLMVEKKKYNQVGGFCEDIAVAYNDVDLCFLLFEEGYYNVQRNDVVLYHHESLSRGNDELSEEKWERLLMEKDKLYERHPAAYGKDPFYSKGLAGNFSDYICSYEYEYEKRGLLESRMPEKCKNPSQFENGCLMIKLEQKEKQKRTDLKDPVVDYRRIEGWSYVLHNDTMRYARLLVLHHVESDCYYQVKLSDRYRRDAQMILEGESEHTALAGFYAFVNFEGMPKGTYEVGMLAKDMCSTQKLFAKTEETILV